MNMIDGFTNKFIDSLKIIERQKDMLEFAGEDKRKTGLINDIANKYMDIMMIFANVSNSDAERKLELIDEHRPKMAEIEEFVKQ